MPPTPTLVSSCRVNGIAQGIPLPGLRGTQIAADEPNRLDSSPTVGPSTPRAGGLDDEFACLEKRLRAEFRDVISNTTKPIEAVCKKINDDVRDLRADQWAFLLREKALQEAMMKQAGTPSAFDSIMLREKSPPLSDDRAQEPSSTIKSQGRDIEELKRQLRDLQKRDADLYKLQSAFEARLQAQVTRGCQESMSRASSAYETCESGLRRLQLELDEFRVLVSKRGAAAQTVGSDTVDLATTSSAPDDVQVDDSVSHRILVEAACSFRQHIVESRTELAIMAAKASETARAGLDEVKAELVQQLQKERVSRHEQIEQARLEFASNAACAVPVTATGPQAELQHALTQNVVDYQLEGLPALQIQVAQAKLELASGDACAVPVIVPEPRTKLRCALAQKVVDYQLEGLAALQLQVAQAKLELAGGPVVCTTGGYLTEETRQIGALTELGQAKLELADCSGGGRDPDKAFSGLVRSTV